MPSNGGSIDDRFSQRYYRRMAVEDAYWRGVSIVKCPFDLWNYQEIIHETKPTLVIETGAYLGGSALFLADMLSVVGEGSGRVLSIELETRRKLPDDARIEFLLGRSSTDPEVLEIVREHAKGERVMVALDSHHSRTHVLRELDLYAPLVSSGCYLVVEDTNIHGLTMANYDQEGGPAAALKVWQPTNKGFEVDRRRERFGFSFNPGGYLKRVR